MLLDRPSSILRVCCGPRCGSEPGHRSLYSAIEVAAEDKPLSVRPTMCQGYCGNGVTVVLPDGTVEKMRDRRDAAEAVSKASLVAASVSGG